MRERLVFPPLRIGLCGRSGPGDGSRVSGEEALMKPMLIAMRTYRAGPARGGSRPCRFSAGAPLASRACPSRGRRRSSTLKEPPSFRLPRRPFGSVTLGGGVRKGWKSALGRFGNARFLERSEGSWSRGFGRCSNCQTAVVGNGHVHWPEALGGDFSDRMKAQWPPLVIWESHCSRLALSSWRRHWGWSRSRVLHLLEPKAASHKPRTD